MGGDEAILQNVVRKMSQETINLLHSDLQERLLILSHNQIQSLLEKGAVNPNTTALHEPFFSLNSINQENTSPLVPLPELAMIIEIIETKLHGRISTDIYRGIILESVQRILSEQLDPIAARASNADKLEVLMIVNANLLKVQRELLSEKREEDGTNNTGENEDELDMVKTRENLWGLITF